MPTPFRKVLLLLISLKYQIFITVLTLYSLFSDDFRTTFFSQTVDPVFDTLSLGVMAIFIVEIILSTLVIEGYFLSFFFFLDVISTISIIFDVNFITDLIFSTSSASSVAQLASQSKASRAATRAVRIVKLFRIIRIIKLYKNSQKAKEIKEQSKQKQLLKEKLHQRKNKERPIEVVPKDQPSSAVQNSENVMLNDPTRVEGKQIYPEERVGQLETSNGNPDSTGDFNDDELEQAIKK